jgi:hypothetical protein
MNVLLAIWEVKGCAPICTISKDRAQFEETLREQRRSPTGHHMLVEPRITSIRSDCPLALRVKKETLFLSDEEVESLLGSLATH